jgi:ABC-2 type transport system permease protein
MAVYEQAYKPFAGELTPQWSRFLIVPRHAYRELFQSKLVTGLFAISFVYPLIAAIIVYLHHNSSALAILDIDVAEIIPINATFFRVFVSVQSSFAFLLILLVAPPLVAKDLANNALPLYLSRPFSRLEYVFGKAMVLVALLSAVTWVPGLIVWGLQAYLEGFAWFTQNAWLGGAILIASWVWIVTMTMLALSLSALLRWSIATRAVLFAILIIPSAFGAIVNAIFRTKWGSIVNINELFRAVWTGLFMSTGRDVLPASVGWVMLALLCAVCALILRRKVRAYEVVR